MDLTMQAGPLTTAVERFRPHVPFAVLGVAVLVLGLLESAFTLEPDLMAVSMLLGVLVTSAFAVAVGITRALPGVALTIVWVVGAAQLAFGVSVLFVQLGVVVIGFACARWGSRPTLWISAVSVPIAVIAIGLAGAGPFGRVVDLLGFNGLIDVALNLGLPWRILIALAAAAILGVPWLIGFALRSTAQVARVTLRAQQAAEIARLQEERSLLALDVHDVVGHSLAVILAQAESAQYLPDDPAKLKQTIATIATSARTSLQDVRHVLVGSGPAPRQLEVDVLLESARAAGFTVADDEQGEPHPLPPELQTVAHRVLQEMITNAIRHGSRKSPIRVTRSWPDGGEADLRIEVSNATEETVALDREGAQGLEGMRRRLESVGGVLEVMPPARKGGRFAVLATIPVRDRANG